MNNNNNRIKLLLLDPALSICGWAIAEVKIGKHKPDNPPKIVIHRTGLIKSSAKANKVAFRDEVNRYSKQLVSLSMLRDTVRTLVDDHNPDFVIIEDAFFNPKRPNAYASLLQCICAVSLFCRDFYNLQVFRIPTRSAKLSLFGSGGAKKKDVIVAVKESPIIVFKQKRSLAELSEHEADAIAVGHHFILNILPGILNKLQVTS